MEGDNVLRVHRNEKYKTVGCYGLEDTRLSMKAKGLLAYMITRPQGWKFYFSQLLSVGTDGQWSMRGAVRELQDAGYLRRNRTNNPETGRVLWKWTVAEAPMDGKTEFTNERKPSDGEPNPSEGLPIARKTHDGKPTPNNKQYYNNDTGHQCEQETTNKLQHTRTEKKKSDLAVAVREVFTYWQTVLGYQDRKLTDARRKCLNARLKHYTVDQLKAVVDFAHQDDFLQGANDRSARFDDIINIFRNDERVDRYLAKRKDPTRVGRSQAPGQGRLF